MTNQRSTADLSSLRDFAVRRLQDADIEFDPTAVGRVINDYYAAGNLLRNQQFIHDNVLFHAGIAFRVSDSPDGERFGLQIVRGNTNKKPDDDSFVERFTEGEITHKTEYNFAKCAIKPLRETHYFLTIDTQLTYRKGKTPAQYQYVGDNDEVREVLTNLQKTMEYMFKTADGISIWLVPIKPVTWGVTVDNLLRQQKGNVLMPYHGSMSDITQLKAANIDRRYKAVALLEKVKSDAKDHLAFKLPKTCDIDQEQEEEKMKNPSEWMKRNVYSLQYATRIGVRKRYDQDHVLVYMANTHLIIKHYNRLQIDLHQFRETISQVLRPYYAKLGHRNAHVRPYMTLPDKSAFVRYTMRDNSLIHDFLVQYLEKAKQNQRQYPTTNDVSNDLDDFDIPDSSAAGPSQPADVPEDIVYVDVGMGAEDISVEREFGEPFVAISKKKFKILKNRDMESSPKMYLSLKILFILMTCTYLYKQTSRPTPTDQICSQDDHHDTDELPIALHPKISWPPKDKENDKRCFKDPALWMPLGLEQLNTAKRDSLSRQQKSQLHSLWRA